MEVRELQESDDRTQFRSGDEDLDRFLHKYAGQNQFRHHIGTTYVALEKGRIVGYATVAPGHLEVEDLPLARRGEFSRSPPPALPPPPPARLPPLRRGGVGVLFAPCFMPLSSPLSAPVSRYGR